MRLSGNLSSQKLSGHLFKGTIDKKLVCGAWIAFFIACAILSSLPAKENLMNSAKIGNLIFKLRTEKNMTQKSLAALLHISAKTVSKWECGTGCPDLSLWAPLSEILGADVQKMLGGELSQNRPDHGNIRKINFYVCPVCGNVMMSTGVASIACCSRRLVPLTVQKAPGHSFEVERMDGDLYVSFEHPMEKEHFITFVAYVTSDKVLFARLYPEQNAEARFPELQGIGKIYAFCNRHGLWSQNILCHAAVAR